MFILKIDNFKQKKKNKKNIIKISFPKNFKLIKKSF